MKLLTCTGVLLSLSIAPPLCHAKPATARFLQKHAVSVTALAYSPDGKTLASADEGGRVILTDVASGQTKLAFRYKQKVAALAYSPDGKMLAVARAKEVRLLDSKTAKAIRVLKTQQEVGGALGFSANGQRLIVSEGRLDKNQDPACSVWAVASGKQLQRHTAKSAAINSAALSPDGKVFAAPDISRTIVDVSLWSVATGKRLRTLAYDTVDRGDEAPYFNTLRFSPDGKYLAGTGSYMEGPGHLTLWTVATGKPKWGRTFADYGSAIAWSPDGSRISVGTEYGTTYDDPNKLHRSTGAPVFNAMNGQLHHSLQRTPNKIRAVAFSPNGLTLATGSSDKTVRLWPVQK